MFTLPTTRRVILNTFYVMFVLWILLILLSIKGYLPIFLPPFLAFCLIFIIGTSVLSIYLFFVKRNWKSEERFAAFLFLVPVFTVLVVPRIVYEYHLRTAFPSEALVRSAIDTEMIGRAQVFNTTSQMSDYQASNHTLAIYLRINPQLFMQAEEQMLRSSEIMEQEKAQYFMNYLYITLMDTPQQMSHYTKIPRKLTVYGYWGNNLILTAYYRRMKGEYRLVPPYPSVSMDSFNNKWILHYSLNSENKEIIVKDGSDAYFNIGLARFWRN